MNIFVSGGLGYIGSHTVVELIQKGNRVIIDGVCPNVDYVQQIHIY